MKPLEDMVEGAKSSIRKGVAVAGMGLASLGVVDGGLHAQEQSPLDVEPDTGLAIPALQLADSAESIDLRYVEGPGEVQDKEEVRQDDLLDRLAMFHAGGVIGDITYLDVIGRDDIEHTGLLLEGEYNWIRDDMHLSVDGEGRLLSYKENRWSGANLFKLGGEVNVPVLLDGLDNGVGVGLRGEFIRFSEAGSSSGFVENTSQEIGRFSPRIVYTNVSDNDLLVAGLGYSGDLINNPGNVRYVHGPSLDVQWNLNELGGTPLGLDVSGSYFKRVGGNDVDVNGRNVSFEGGSLLEFMLGLRVEAKHGWSVGLGGHYKDASEDFMVEGVPDNTVSSALGVSVTVEYIPNNK